MGTVPVADVLAAPLRPISTLVVWRSGAACMVAVVSSLLRGGADPLGACRLPGDLLLLPGRVLQGLLGRSSRLRGRRTAEEVPRRAVVPAGHPEHPSILPLRRDRHR